MSGPAVFKGLYAYLLAANGLEHKNGMRQASGAIDPSVTPFDAPAGSTYQSTLTGKIYIKTDAGSSTNWISLQTYPSQCVEVAKIGGEYSSIQSAINSVTDATSSKVYCIHVHEGIYVENITLKPFVVLVGVANGPAAPVIQGKITASFSTPGEFTLINRMQQSYTIASDNDRAINVTGGLLINDFFSNVTCSADYNYNAFYLNGTTFPCILYSGTLTVTNTFDGSTKTQIGVYQTGPADTIDYAFSVNMSTKASSGLVACRQISTTGASQVDSDGNKFAINNVKAGSTAEFVGTYISTATTGFRLSKNDQVRITGSGGGTATLSKLNSGGNSAVFFTAGLVGFIDSTFTGQVTDTATGDTQEVWLNSTNRNLLKTGAGLAIITPYDLVNTGFSQWSTVGATYFSYVPGTRVFTLEKRFTGVVLSAPVVAAAGQTVTCVDNQVNYIYADDNGVLQVTQTASAAIYDSGIPVFQLYSDGTNFRVKKENHPVSWPTSVSQFVHKMFGSALENNGGGTISTLVAASRTVQLIGATTAVDHGLETTLPDSTGVALTWHGSYTGPSGMVWDAAAFGVTAIPSKWQNTGTTIANGANGNRIVVRCGVLLDNLNSTAPQYVFSYHNAVYGSNAAAAAAIAAGSILDFPQSLYGLEIVQLGYVTIQANGAGAGTIVAVTPAKKILGQIFTGGAASSSAALNLTDTTTFDGQLSGAETTTQVSFNRLDDYGYIPLWSATYNAAAATYRVGNVVGQNGGIYRCNTAHTATTFAADKANWTQVSPAKVNLVADAEALIAKDNDILYVAETYSWYYFTSISSGVDDNKHVLSTGVGGTTRWLGFAGQYIYGTTSNLSTDANVIPAGTMAQRPVAVTAGSSRFNKTTGHFEGADGASFRSLANRADLPVFNEYESRAEVDFPDGTDLLVTGGWTLAAGTATAEITTVDLARTSGGAPYAHKLTMGAASRLVRQFLTIGNADTLDTLKFKCAAKILSGDPLYLTIYITKDSNEPTVANDNILATVNWSPYYYEAIELDVLGISGTNRYIQVVCANPSSVSLQDISLQPVSKAPAVERKNFVSNPNAESGLTGISSTGVNAVTIAQELTGPLFGTRSFKFTQGVAGAWEVTWTVDTLPSGLKNRLGELALVMQGQPLTGGYLRVFSGATKVFEQLASNNLVLDPLNPKKFGGSFPLGDLSTFTIKLGGSAAISGNLFADQVYLGEPVSVSSGAIQTPRADFLPTFYDGNTPLTVTGFGIRKQWRNGQHLGMEVDVRFGTQTGTGILKMGLPPGLNIDTTAEIVGGSANANVGNWSAFISGIQQTNLGMVTTNNAETSTLVFAETSDLPSGSGANALLRPVDLSGREMKILVVNVPISGWQATDIVTPAASTSGQARYTTNAGQVIPNITSTIINFEDKDYDSGSEVTVGASWKFTAKTPGHYQVDASVLFDANVAWENGEDATIYIYKNGAIHASRLVQATASVSQYVNPTISDVVYLNSGDYIDIRVVQISDASLPLSSTPSYNRISISKINGPGSQSFYVQGPVRGANTGEAIPAGYVGNQAGTAQTTTNMRRFRVSTLTVAGINSTLVTLATLTLNKGSYLITGRSNQQKSNSANSASLIWYFFDGAVQIYPAVGGIAQTQSVALGYVQASFAFPLDILNDGTQVTLRGAWLINETAGTDAANELTATLLN